jgi:squalene-hopene/tetraprenyl-beta-curcumene cyclase
VSMELGSKVKDKRGSLDLLTDAAESLCDRLVGLMQPEGFWEGRLSSSALSTATAISALSLADDESDMARLHSGVAWLIEHHNSDGGWGDTADSPSNLATTLLVVSALKLATNGISSHTHLAHSMKRVDEYLLNRSAGAPKDIVQAIQSEYGQDRTFAIPILMNCALAGLAAWSDIPGLPFELAVFPHSWYKILRLHVVSYALPALIAIGLLLDRRNPPHNFLKRLIRKAVAPHVLKILQNIQPEDGGFLEAVPLTSFVAMGLLPLFGRDQPVATNCLRFIRQLQRSDGSWPIDTNLSVWLTTSAVSAMGAAGQLSKIDQKRSAEWICARQYKSPHAYTQASPCGWGWTHLAGGVPDADDTSGAIIALVEMGHNDGVEAGVRWLLELQNSDGGWPTFCRGWGKLAFDKSSPDITAHTLRALIKVDPIRFNRLHRAIRKGLKYLYNVQQSDGSWLPLWFGNQAASGRANPVIGVSLVLRVLEILDPHGPQAARGTAYLSNAQNADGGWGGAKSIASSLEETALAVAALAAWRECPEMDKVLSGGVEYMLREMEKTLDRPVPIGLYFSHLWYSEKLYPLVWTIEALGRMMKKPGVSTSYSNNPRQS